MYKSFFKRIIDFSLALVGLIVLSPILLLTTIFLLFANNGKVFFFQERPGKRNKVFKIIKFKTMTDKKDNYGNLLPDYKRITKVGSFVRKSSLDEIPQLFNVLAGQMSLIGPRPLLVDYLELYNDFQMRRQEVKPGITGWAQVNGRNAVTWSQRFDMDIWYVENVSFILDLRIIFLTIFKVFKTEGVSPSESVTMERFKGNN